MGLSPKREYELRELAHKKYGWDRKRTDGAIEQALKYSDDFNPEKQIALTKKNLKEEKLRIKRAEYENQVCKSRHR